MNIFNKVSKYYRFTFRKKENYKKIKTKLAYNNILNKDKVDSYHINTNTITIQSIEKFDDYIFESKNLFERLNI
jgi:hypothetical protein